MIFIAAASVTTDVILLTIFIDEVNFAILANKYSSTVRDLVTIVIIQMTYTFTDAVAFTKYWRRMTNMKSYETN